MSDSLSCTNGIGSGRAGFFPLNYLSAIRLLKLKVLETPFPVDDDDPGLPLPFSCAVIFRPSTMVSEF
ncbi:unnamed protein product [Linum trigynum]|uniref:Uncharacterized protein n=1 Tax=Linum trigynum TaxID=586398 RepID=A0AAV2FZ40_9ROSI